MYSVGYYFTVLNMNGVSCMKLIYIIANIATGSVMIYFGYRIESFDISEYRTCDILYQKYSFTVLHMNGVSFIC